MLIFSSKLFWLLLCLAVLAAPVAWYATLGVGDTINQLRADHVVTETDGKISSFDGTEIAYKVEGNGAKTLLFLHGWTRSSSDWSDHAVDFSSQYKTVTIDLAGHGASGLNRTEWTIKSFSRDVEAVIDHLELKNVIIVGHSLGGLVALETARTSAESTSGVVIVDEISNVESKESFSTVLTARLLSLVNYEYTLQLFLGDYFGEEPDENLKNRVIAESYSLPPTISRSILFGKGGYFDYFNNEVLPAFKAAKAPIAFINAEGENFPNETNLKYQPTVIMEEIPNSGHFLIVENPNEFSGVLQSVLDKWDGR